MLDVARAVGIVLLLTTAACSTDENPDPNGFDPGSVDGKWISPKGSLPLDSGLVLDLAHNLALETLSGTSLWLHGSRARPGALQGPSFSGGELRFQLEEVSFQDGRATITFYASSFSGTLSEDGRRISGTLRYEGKEETLYVVFERVLRPPELQADWVTPIGLPEACRAFPGQLSNDVDRMTDLGDRLGLVGRFFDRCDGNTAYSRESSFFNPESGVQLADHRIAVIETIGGTDRPAPVQQFLAGPDGGLAFALTLTSYAGGEVRVEANDRTLRVPTSTTGGRLHLGLGLSDASGAPTFLSVVGSIASQYATRAVRFSAAAGRFVVITSDQHILVARDGTVGVRTQFGGSEAPEIATAAILEDGSAWITAYQEPGMTLVDIPNFQSERGHFLAKLDAAGQFVFAVSIEESIGRLEMAPDGGVYRQSPYRLARHDSSGTMVWQNEALGSANLQLSAQADTLYVFNRAWPTGVLELEGQYFDAPQHLYEMDGLSGAIKALFRVPGEHASMALVVRSDKRIFVAGGFKNTLAYQKNGAVALPIAEGLEADVFVGRFRFPN